MQHWIYRANLNRFRLHDFIKDFGFVEYLQVGDIKVGDVVYLYLTAPYKRVEYKMVVEKVEIPSKEQFDDSSYSLTRATTTDDSTKKVVRFKFIEHVKTNKLCYRELRKHGFNLTMQSDRKIDGEIVDYIESFFHDKPMKKAKGFVYILTNKSFRDDWVKIGKSSRPVDIRSKELDNTAVPLPFDIFATIQTEKYAEIERIIHKQIDRLTDLRIRQNREFFNVHPDQALEILLDLAMAIEDAVVMKYEDGKPFQVYPPVETPRPKRKEKKEQRKPFAFDMIGLKVGDIITFDPLKLNVRVASSNKVEYEGRLWSLSAFTGTYLPDDQRNQSESYQGPKYFSYNGKTLWQIRLEKEVKK